MKHLIILIVFCLISLPASALKTDVKGFVALDILEVAKKESQEATFSTGIGTLNLKFYAYHENMSFKLKLDLDGDLTESAALFEEASATYRIKKTLKLTMGKGKVPFQQLRYGVTDDAYICGGSVLGTYNSIRKQNKKLLLTLTLGSYKSGWMNHFTFFGDSRQIKKNRDGSPDLDAQNKLQYEGSNTFSTDNERGLADKFEVFWKDFSAYASAFYYFNDVHPLETYAFDIGGRYRTKETEIWFETMWGFYSTHSGAQYPAYKQYEQVIQLGAEQYLSKYFNYMINMEAMHVKKADWYNNGYDNTWMKIDTGVKYKIRKNAFFTYGVMLERMKSSKNEVDQGARHGLGTKVGLSFWY